MSELKREKQTIQAMATIYCRDHHGTDGTLCVECDELLAYAHARLEACPYGEDKPTCVKCPIHCYKPAMKERVRIVMRYAGPRMVTRHPVMALRHLVNERRPAPEGRPPRKAKSTDA
jgi:predicted amidophosphoribosyltransferase